MIHPYYTTSFVDREMFAYNAEYQKKQTQREKLQQHLSQPETRIKYAFAFLDDHGFDSEDDYSEEVRVKCYNGIAKYSEQLDTSESHF